MKRVYDFRAIREMGIRMVSAVGRRSTGQPFRDGGSLEMQLGNAAVPPRGRSAGHPSAIARMHSRLVFEFPVAFEFNVWDRAQCA